LENRRDSRRNRGGESAERERPAQKTSSPDGNTGARMQKFAASLGGWWNGLTQVLTGRQREIQIRRKIWIIFIPVAGLFAAAAVRVVFLTTRNTKDSTRSALSQFNYASTVDVAKPGDILDANGLTLAGSYSVYRLILDPSVMYETEELRPGSIAMTVHTVAQIFDLDEEDLLNQISANASSQYLRYNVKSEDGTASGVFVSYEQRNEFEAAEEACNSKVDKEKTSDGSRSDSSGSAASSAATVAKDKEPRIAGVWFEEEMRRNYPYSELDSKIIGFSTRDTTQGLWGLALYYDDVLQGINGKSYGYINDNTDMEHDVTPAEDGKTLQTTLDVNLTRLIRDEVETWLAQTDDDGNLINTAKSVDVLAMDPNTGAIKAYVSSSDYDLNSPENMDSLYTAEEQAVFAANQEAYDAALEAWQDAHSGEEESSASGEEAEAAADGTAQTQETAGTAASVEAAQADGQDTAAVGGSGADPSADKFDWDFDNYPTTDYVLNSIWRNDMISTSYEPGSTGKVITYAAALEENAVTEDTPFSDPGSIQVGSTIINCHNKDLGGCGDINAEIGLENSCNVAFVGIGQALGVHNFVKYQKMFNFGQLTGVDLPGEVNCAGLLFPEDQMTDLDLATNAFGQCYNVTMLQMATAFSAAINGGTYYRPYVVSAILNADGTTAQTIEPEPVRQVISEETSRRVREALSLVVYGESGTGGRMPYADGKYLSGYHFIAKTGTAQKLPRADKKYLISVISAVPEDSPQLVLYVTIDEYGGALQADSYPAQQLSGEIWGAVLDYIGVYSDDAADVDRYRYDTTGAAASDEEWNDGTLSMENLEGGPLGTPEPPADDGSGEDTSSLLISPDEILNPDSALPDPESAG